MNRTFAALLATATFSLTTSVSRADAQVNAFVTSSKVDTARSTLPSTTPRVYVIYSTQGVKAGDKFRGALVADHADHIAPEKRNMIEAELTLDGDTDAGALSFKKPVGDWPVGDYHVEIYINDKLVATAKFTITPAN